MLQEKQCLDRAKKLINSGTAENLKYACLELRMCIETLCYSIFKLYLKQIPEEILKESQPRKLMKILKELDPYVEDDCMIVIGLEDNAGALPKASYIGQHKAMTIRFIRDTYDKLGYFLHIPSISQRSQHSKKLGDLRNDLESMIPKLEGLCSNNFISNLAPVITFKCKRCSKHNVKNKESLKKNNVVICIDENCKAEYIFIDNIGKPTFLLAQTACNCPSCKTQFVLDKHKLKEEMIIKCKKCRKQLMFYKLWGIKVLDRIKKEDIKQKRHSFEQLIKSEGQL